MIPSTTSEFQYFSEQFADLRILKYKVHGFEQLPVEQKKLIYFLSQATIAGRDILFDQHFQYNLLIRFVFEKMIQQLSESDKNNLDPKLLEYTKRIWFSSGIHHHYSTLKIKPSFSSTELSQWFKQCNWTQWFNSKQSECLLELIQNTLFDDKIAAKRVWNNPGDDLITNSCNNFYRNISQHEASQYYETLKSKAGSDCPSFGLNSQLVKNDSQITEIKWYADGMYGQAIQHIIHWLKKAKEVAETNQQAKVIQLLIDFYQSGDLTTFDHYNIEWLKEQKAQVDFINGFIEVYADPMGIKGTWEALVNIMDIEETIKTKVISEQAQWFEDNSPVDARFKKEEVKGVSMKIIQAITLGGDCYPASPLGINLPNADWIREKHGSKSVSLSNISEAHQQASLSTGVIEEFAATQQEIELHKQYGAIADHLHTHLHECVGHGSGRMLPGITSEMLQSNASVIEEARADLFGLYFIADPKMIDLNLIPSLDVAKTQYNSYIRNGLMVQLTRIEAGQKIEQAHMRNRQLISRWVLEKGAKDNVIEQLNRDNKTYFKINDYTKLRELFGELLKEVQRIKSEGDSLAAAKLVETYGVNIDPSLHNEILERYKKLNLAPFTGFLNPVLTPIKDETGNICDISINYDETYQEQMMRYSHENGYLVNLSINDFCQAIH